MHSPVLLERIQYARMIHPRVGPYVTACDDFNYRLCEKIVMANDVDFLNAIRMGLNQGRAVGQPANAQLGVLGPMMSSMKDYQAPNQERHNFFMSTDTGTPVGGFAMPAQRRWNR